MKEEGSNAQLSDNGQNGQHRGGSIKAVLCLKVFEGGAEPMASFEDVQMSPQRTWII